MKTPVQNLIRRPSRSLPVIILALLLLIVGGLGIWALGNRLLNGAWPGWNILSSQRARLHDHRVASGTRGSLLCDRMQPVHDSPGSVAGSS